MDNQLVWRLSNASLSTQSAPSPLLITIPYPPNQPHHPHSSPSPICLISPITSTPHPPLSAQSAPSASLITLPYPPYQPHHPHSSPSPICLISPICLTHHPPLSAQSAPSASLITLPYLPNQPHHPHSSPSSIPKASKGFSKTYSFVVYQHTSLHIKSSLIVDLKNAFFCNYQAISCLQMIIFSITSRIPLPF